MEYKQQERQFSTRPAIDPANYEFNSGRRGDGFTDFDEMFCPWCEDWVITIKSSNRDLDLEMLFCYIFCCCCTLAEAICCREEVGGDIYHDCSRCHQRLARREGHATFYYLPAGDGSIQIEGGQNEVIALAHRSTAQSIEYAHRAADIYTALWLSWYDDHGLWVHNYADRVDDTTHRHAMFNFCIWADKLWEDNFRSENFSKDEISARQCDASHLFSVNPKGNLSTHPMFWKEYNSPWIWQAANFLNKELGPGPELCKAWKLLLEDYNRLRRGTNHFIALHRVTLRDIEMPTLKSGFVCKYPDECVCQHEPEPEDFDIKLWHTVRHTHETGRRQLVKLQE